MTIRKLITALAVLPFMAGSANAQELPKTKFNVVGSIGVLAMYKDLEVPFWTKTISDASNGAVTAEIKPFTELGFKGPEIFNLVSDGTLQMAHIVLPYTSGSVPMNEAADLVGVVESVAELYDAVNSFRATHAEFLATKHNMKLLGYGVYHSQVVYCRESFTNLSDLKGRKVRASGASQQVFLKYLEASPISLAFGEVQAGLATGVVDCAITGALSGYLAKWHESASFISPMPINHGVVAVAANMDWWTGLDPAVQRFLETQVGELETLMFNAAATEADAGISCNTGGACSYGSPANMTLVPVTDADRTLRDEAVKSAVLPAYKQRCGESCAQIWNDTIGAKLGFVIQ